jgi:CopG family nickel-responsive transcriptional regulator
MATRTPPQHRIISISLTDEQQREFERVRRDGGFSGRSETVRAGLRLLSQEQEARRALRGTVSCLLAITLDEERSDELAHVLHEHRAAIRTQLHDHLPEHRCVELLVLRGDAREIARLSKACEICRGVRRCQLVTL